VIPSQQSRSCPPSPPPLLPTYAHLLRSLAATPADLAPPSTLSARLAVSPVRARRDAHTLLHGLAPVAAVPRAARALASAGVALPLAALLREPAACAATDPLIAVPLCETLVELTVPAEAQRRFAEAGLVGPLVAMLRAQLSGGSSGCGGDDPLAGGSAAVRLRGGAGCGATTGHPAAVSDDGRSISNTSGSSDTNAVSSGTNESPSVLSGSPRQHTARCRQGLSRRVRGGSMRGGAEHDSPTEGTAEEGCVDERGPAKSTPARAAILQALRPAGAGSHQVVLIESLCATLANLSGDDTCLRGFEAVSDELASALAALLGSPYANAIEATWEPVWRLCEHLSRSACLRASVFRRADIQAAMVCLP